MRLPPETQDVSLSTADTLRRVNYFDRRCISLAYGEVRLPLTGARLAEGHPTNLHHRQAQAGIICPTAHLTLLLFASCLDQEALLLSQPYADLPSDFP